MELALVCSKRRIFGEFLVLELNTHSHFRVFVAPPPLQRMTRIIK